MKRPRAGSRPKGGVEMASGGAAGGRLGQILGLGAVDPPGMADSASSPGAAGGVGGGDAWVTRWLAAVPKGLVLPSEKLEVRHVPPSPSGASLQLAKLLCLQALFVKEHADSGDGLPEVEARFGLYRPGTSHFASGVPQVDFDALKSALSRDLPVTESVETDFRYERGVRVTYAATHDESLHMAARGALPSAVVIKQTHALLEMPVWNCRIAVAVESRVPFHSPTHSSSASNVSSSFELPPAVISKREKRRSSFEAATDSVWRIDLTQVRKWNLIQGELRDCGTVCEVEVELSASFLTSTRQALQKALESLDSTSLSVEEKIEQLLASDDSGQSPPMWGASVLMAQLSTLTSQLAALRALAASAPPDAFKELPGSLLSAEEAAPHRAQVQRLCGRPGDTSMKAFPGAMPVNLTRRLMPNLSRRSYFVSEKADGVRFLLLVSNVGVFLVNRSMEVFRVHEVDGLRAVFLHQRPEVLGETGTLASDVARSDEERAKPRVGPLLLDGEVVRNRDTGSLVYLIFDVLAMYGECKVGLPLSGRLPYIGEVVGRYRAACERGLQRDGSPFALIGKHFERLPRLSTVLNHLIYTDPLLKEHFFFDKGKRHHRADGLMLTPDVPYYHSAPLMKWKYPHLLTVDFAVLEVAQNELQLQCRGDGGLAAPIVIGAPHFQDSDLQRLYSDMAAEAVQLHRSPILECSYNASLGIWHYHCLRRDKPFANHISVVLDTLLSMTENITSKDLLEFVRSNFPSSSHSSSGSSQSSHPSDNSTSKTIPSEKSTGQE